MSFIEMILVAVSLAMDAGAVCLSAAAAGFVVDRRAAFRLVFHFGLFQFLMPLVGGLLGSGVISYLDAFDQWIAFGLLLFVGGRMIWEGISQDVETTKKDPTRGMTMVMLSIATSIDALAVGLGLAMLKVSILYPAVLIGVITCGISMAAVFTGRRLGNLFGSRMEIVGGLILIFIGCKILLTS